MTRLGLNHALFSSARRKFPIYVVENSPGKKGIRKPYKKKSFPSGQREVEGGGREALGGVGDFFPKKHLEKQSGVNKETATHCPPNK